MNEPRIYYTRDAAGSDEEYCIFTKEPGLKDGRYRFGGEVVTFAFAPDGLPELERGEKMVFVQSRGKT